ncbi:MAG: hypothetical protein U0943_15145, partial [Brevundimonas sp.]|nr:hypothetical protein [Brevundimonas sp.]
MSTDADKPLNGATEPFRRPVIWGRPPQTVFRAGPLPKGERLPPLPEPPRESQVRPPRAVGQGILSGSMIPRAAPRPAPQALTTETPVVPPPEARPEPAPRPVPTLHASDPDLTVRPLPPLEPGPT